MKMHKVEDSTKKLYSSGKKFRDYKHPVVQAFAKPKIKWIDRQIGLKGKKVLEVGAGNGYMSHGLAKLCNLTALDISQEQLEQNPVKKKIVGSVYQLPFEENTFDIILCSNLLHHLEQPNMAVSEMIRVSREYIVANEPNNLNPYIALARIFPFLLPRDERNNVYYSRQFLINLLESNGSRVLNHTYSGGFVSPKVNPSILLKVSFPESTSPLSVFQIVVAAKIAASG